MCQHLEADGLRAGTVSRFIGPVLTQVAVCPGALLDDPRARPARRWTPPARCCRGYLSNVQAIRPAALPGGPRRTLFQPAKPFGDLFPYIPGDRKCPRRAVMEIRAHRCSIVAKEGLEEETSGQDRFDITVRPYPFRARSRSTLRRGIRITLLWVIRRCKSLMKSSVPVSAPPRQIRVLNAGAKTRSTPLSQQFANACQLPPPVLCQSSRSNCIAGGTWMTKSILVTCCTGRSAGLLP